MYVNGHIRQVTGSYFGVSVLIIINAWIGLGLSVYLRGISQKEEVKHGVPKEEYFSVRNDSDSEIPLEQLPREDDEEVQNIKTYAGNIQMQADSEAPTKRSKKN